MPHDPAELSGAPGTRSAGFADFLAVIFRRKGVILGLFAVVTVTVGILTLTRPVDYASYGKVMVKRGEQESVMSPGRRIAGWEEELATEAQVIKSASLRDLAQAALDERRRGTASPIRIDAGAIGVQVIGQSNVIEISYVARDPEVAYQACDAVVNAYVDYRSAAETLPYPKSFFESELGRVNAAIDSLQRVRRTFTQNQDVVDIGEQQRSLLGALASLKLERGRTNGDLAEATGNLRALATMAQNPDTDIPVFGEGYLNEEALRDLKKSILQQETRIAQMQERYREDAPQLVDTRAALESMRGLLKREVEQGLRLAQARVQGLRSRLETADLQIARAEAELAELPAKEARLVDLDQQLTVLKARLLGLTQDSDRARVTEQTSRRVNIVVLSAATPARVRATHDYVRLALAPAFSLVVGIGLAFFIDGLDTRLRTARDVEDATELPVLASLAERKR